MSSTPKILIIEDEPAIREMYAFKLENDGYVVQTSANGISGLEIARNWQPDLILLDLKMPRMSGDEMLELLRREEWGANIRVIILTNISKNEAPHALRFLRVDRYIVKAHYTPSQVSKVVQEVLGS